MFLKLGRQAGIKIAIVYLVTLSLLVGVGVLVIIQFNRISTAVNTLTDDLAVERALSKDIVSQILLARFHANQYVRTQLQVDLDRFNQEFTKLEALLNRAHEQIVNPERVEMLGHITQTVQAYEVTFKEVTRLVKHRQRIYADVLDIEGLVIESELTALRVHILFLNDPAAFLAFDNVQNAFRQMSLDVSKYLEAGDERYLVQFEEHYRQAREALSSLGETLTDLAQRQNVKDAEAATDAYYHGVQIIHTDYVELKGQLDTMLNVLEPEISRTALDIATSVDEAFKAQNDSSQNVITRTRLMFLGIVGVVATVSLGFGMLLFRYVTERLQAEKVLRESERRYRTLFEGTPVGLYRSTPAGKILDVNPACVQMLGYPDRETLLSTPAVELYVDAAVRRRWRALVEQEGNVRNFKVWMRRHDGTVILVRNSTRTIRGSRGKARYYEGSFEDITEQVRVQEELKQYRNKLEKLVRARTAELIEINAQLRQEIVERKQTEAALEQAKKAAEQANQAKSLFLANMSHELRTPLNAILGFSELMAQGPNLTLDQRHDLETIGRSGEHLLALINDVLDLSKIEAGRVEILPEDFDLHHMLSGLEEMFRLRAKVKGLTLDLECTPDVPRYVHADQGKLRQVLINLLSNAVKFTEHGRVTLRVELVNKGTSAGVDASSCSGSACLAFEVTDTGAGIASHELDKVFETFVQTESGKRSRRGTGLGLPISRRYVQMMGGDLHVLSTPGQGTRFTFQIPVQVVDVAKAPEAHSTRRVVGLAPEQPTYRLLIAEDIETNRELLVKWLEPLGFAVRTAVNGREAITIWEAWQPHLIWMDLRMPVMGGYEATQHIKATPQGQQTVIVALTASAFEENRVEILEAGCDGFVRKPFREKDILDVLQRHLSVRFVYESVDAPAVQWTDKGQKSELLPRLIHMPESWLYKLHQATLEGDLMWISALIDGVRDRDATLAKGLHALADDFAHGTILSLIKRAIVQDQERDNE